MNKEQIDQLYHLLRVASNSGDPENQLFYGLARHLLAGGDYLSLIQYSCNYGEKFLLSPTTSAIKNTGWQVDRVVEFGAGLGWLGRRVAAGIGYLPTLFVDKRQWTMIDIIADLETEAGRNKVLEQMKDGDLIVMSDFLHCLDDPETVMSYFSKWPAVILEYCSTDPDYMESYATQINRYGAKFSPTTRYREMFPNRKVDAVDIDPYILLLVDKEAR